MNALHSVGARHGDAQGNADGDGDEGGDKDDGERAHRIVPHAQKADGEKGDNDAKRQPHAPARAVADPRDREHHHPPGSVEQDPLELDQEKEKRIEDALDLVAVIP